MSAPRHMPQLDALRAFAVFAVMLVHFSPTVQRYLPTLGFLGVRLFFVLSGFLITGILLRCRDRAVVDGSLGPQLRRFYIRRALRIFPAFYVTLFVATLFAMGSARESFWWHFLYLSNLFMAVRGAWADLVSHFWSLAVEEQFYLVWPALICLVPARLLPHTMLFAIALGPLTRGLCVALAPGNAVAPIVLTPACLDFLGAGALLAWMWHTGAMADRRPTWRRFGLGLVLIGLPCELALQPSGPAAAVLLPTVHALGFAALVDGAACGFAGGVGRVLSWRPLLWVGQISYGLYLTHNFAHWWAPRVMRQLTGYRHAYFASEILHVLFLIALSFAAAIASWHLVERPANQLKSRFDYGS